MRTFKNWGIAKANEHVSFVLYELAIDKYIQNSLKNNSRWVNNWFKLSDVEGENCDYAILSDTNIDSIIKIAVLCYDTLKLQTTYNINDFIEKVVNRLKDKYESSNNKELLLRIKFIESFGFNDKLEYFMKISIKNTNIKMGYNLPEIELNNMFNHIKSIFLVDYYDITKNNNIKDYWKAMFDLTEYKVNSVGSFVNSIRDKESFLKLDKIQQQSVINQILNDFKYDVLNNITEESWIYNSTCQMQHNTPALMIYNFSNYYLPNKWGKYFKSVNVKSNEIVGEDKSVSFKEGPISLAEINYEEVIDYKSVIKDIIATTVCLYKNQKSKSLAECEKTIINTRQEMVVYKLVKDMCNDRRTRQYADNANIYLGKVINVSDTKKDMRARYKSADNLFYEIASNKDFDKIEFCRLYNNFYNSVYSDENEPRKILSENEVNRYTKNSKKDNRYEGMTIKELEDKYISTYFSKIFTGVKSLLKLENQLSQWGLNILCMPSSVKDLKEALTFNSLKDYLSFKDVRLNDNYNKDYLASYDFIDYENVFNSYKNFCDNVSQELVIDDLDEVSLIKNIVEKEDISDEEKHLLSNIDNYYKEILYLFKGFNDSKYFLTDRNDSKLDDVSFKAMRLLYLLQTFFNFYNTSFVKEVDNERVSGIFADFSIDDKYATKSVENVTIIIVKYCLPVLIKIFNAFYLTDQRYKIGIQTSVVTRVFKYLEDKEKYKDKVTKEDIDCVQCYVIFNEVLNKAFKDFKGFFKDFNDELKADTKSLKALNDYCKKLTYSKRRAYVNNNRESYKADLKEFTKFIYSYFENSSVPTNPFKYVVSSTSEWYYVYSVSAYCIKGYIDFVTNTLSDIKNNSIKGKMKIPTLSLNYCMKKGMLKEFREILSDIQTYSLKLSIISEEVSKNGLRDEDITVIAVAMSKIKSFAPDYASFKDSKDTNDKEYMLRNLAVLSNVYSLLSGINIDVERYIKLFIDDLDKLEEVIEDKFNTNFNRREVIMHSFTKNKVLLYLADNENKINKYPIKLPLVSKFFVEEQRVKRRDDSYVNCSYVYCRNVDKVSNSKKNKWVCTMTRIKDFNGGFRIIYSVLTIFGILEFEDTGLGNDIQPVMREIMDTDKDWIMLLH